MTQQLFAKIKKSSKYFGQNETAIQKPERYGGFPFPVRVVGFDQFGYVVKGGPGGQYRLADVSLFIVDQDRELQIS